MTTKARLYRMMVVKEAKNNLVRGINADLVDWGLKGGIEQVTSILLRFEKFQEDLGESPTFEFWKDTPRPAK